LSGIFCSARLAAFGCVRRLCRGVLIDQLKAALQKLKPKLAVPLWPYVASLG
jgi:hypothetical protein